VGVGVLAATAIYSRLQLCSGPSAIYLVVAAVRLILHRARWASIAGIAETEQRLRRIDFGGAGCALATNSLVLNSRSSLWRLISRSRFRGNAPAGATKPEVGNHQWPSTNSLSSSAVMPPRRKLILAAATGEA
jgi:hypothetical protein